MKNFMQRGFVQKLIISIVCCMIMLNFCITSTVQASFGGKLMTHIIDFAAGIADVIGSIVQFGLTGHLDSAVDSNEGKVESDLRGYFKKKGIVDYPILQVSPEVIFANGVQFLDVNFVSNLKPKSEYRVTLEDQNVLETLRNVIAGWYVTLRTIAIVGLLSVLIYIGIRIIISSTGQDKAKYKQRLIDWLVAFCLLFLMHYIMSALLTVVEKVNNVLGEASGVYNGLTIDPSYGKISYNKANSTSTAPEGMVSIEDEDGVLKKIQNYFANKYAGFVTETNKLQLNYANSGSWTFHISDNPIIDREILYMTYDMTPQTILCLIDKNGSIDDNNRYYTVSFGTEHTIEDTIVNMIAGSQKYLEDGSFILGDVYTEEEARAMAQEDRVAVQEIINMTNEAIRNSSLPTETVPETLPATSTKAATQLNYDGHTIWVSGDSSKVLYFVNYARLMIESNDDDKNIPTKIAFLIIYVALIVFTAVFTFRYIKRVIYIAFLTLMAPMVALTYPLDKLKDRKSTSMGYVV